MGSKPFTVNLDEKILQQIKDKYLEGGWSVKYDRGYFTFSTKE